MKSIKIGIIGFGKMGKALYSGLKKNSVFSDSTILVSNVNATNAAIAEAADVVFLAVHPDKVKDVLETIKPVLTRRHLVVSIASRVTIADIKDHIGEECAVIRAMPNLCATIGESMSCWVKSDDVTLEQSETAKEIIASFGREILLPDEELLNAVTPLVGCGPAVFLYLAEIYIEYLDDKGVERGVAQRLVVQVMSGTSSLLTSVPDTPQQIIESIQTRGGTTETIMDTLLKRGYRKIVSEALDAGRQKAIGHR